MIWKKKKKIPKEGNSQRSPVHYKLLIFAVDKIFISGRKWRREGRGRRKKENVVEINRVEWYKLPVRRFLPLPFYPPSASNHNLSASRGDNPGTRLVVLLCVCVCCVLPRAILHLSLDIRVVFAYRLQCQKWAPWAGL